MGVALAACAGAPSPAPSVSVALVQQRGDIAPGRVQLRVTNAGDASVTVTSATLDAPVLSQPGGGATKRPVTLSPGQTTDLPVLLPVVRCATGEAVAQAVLVLRDGDGTQERTFDVTDDLGVLTRLSATACDREVVASVAHISAESAKVAADGTIDLQLAIEPTGDAHAASVDLLALRGTPLLRFPTGTEAPLALTVRADDAPSTVTVTVEPQRCDAHAIAEDKVGTLFDLIARADGREVVVPLERSSTVASALLSATAEVCGLIP